MKKNLLTVLILALIVVDIVLTAVMMISVMGTNKKTAELVTNIATVMNLELTVPGEEDKNTEVSIADTEVVSLGTSMTIPLATDENGKQGYIMLDIALSLNKKHEDYDKYSSTVSGMESLILDAISKVVSSHTETECRDDFEGVRTEILESIQDLYKSDFIYNIAVNNIKYG